MSLKPKAVRRLLLLGGLTVTLAVLVLALVFVRSWQNNRRTEKLRTEGLAAFNSGDHPVVLDNLAGYLRRKPQDREAWLAFAESREKVEEAEGKHLPQAAVAYRRAWALDEKDTKTARKLLTIYGEIGYFVEARDLAMTLRPADGKLAEATPEMAEVLLEECAARISLKAFDRTLDLLTARLMELAPTDYRTAFLRSGYLIGADRKPDAISLGESLPKEHPGDAGFEFAGMIIQDMAGRRTGVADARTALGRIAGFKIGGDKLRTPLLEWETAPRYNDASLALRLVAAFDSVDLHENALTILRDTANRLKDPIARRLATRRQWQLGRSEELLKDLPNPDLSASGEAADILGFMALASRELQRSDDLEKYTAALRARARNFAARSWTSCLAALAESSDPRKRMTLLDAALKENPNEPVFLYLRGDTLRTLGRADEARQIWNSVYASPLAECWSTPAARVAESLLDEGRIEEGLQASRLALSKDSASPTAQFSRLRAICESITAKALTYDVAKFEEIIQSIQATAGPKGLLVVDRLALPARATLLASQNRKEEAIAELRRALDTPGLLDTTLARRLAQVSLAGKLGLEERLLAAAAAPSSGGSGNLLDRALLLDSQSKRDQALRLLDDALKAAPPSDRVEFTTIRAQFLDTVDAPEALDAWKSTIEAFPDSIPVILAALRSRSVPSDRGLVEKLSERLTALGGSDPDHPSVDIRLARARALILGPAEVRTRDEAVGLLRAMVIETPSRTDTRDALIDALLLENRTKGVLPDVPAAIEQLTATAAVARDRANHTLRLAQLLDANGRRPEAIASLSALVLDASVGREDRLRVVERLARFSAFEPALRGVASLKQTASPDDPAVLAAEAMLLTRLARPREAIDAYKRLLRLPLTNARDILTAASDLRDLGEPEAATAALSKLDDPAISPVDRALCRGSYLARGESSAPAAEEFRKATTLAPKDPRVWTAAARFLRDRGELAPAESLAREGLLAIPGNPELEVLLQQIILASKKDDQPDLNPLADALAKNPGTARQAEALRAISAAQKAGTLADPATLTKLAKDYPEDPITQLFTARRLLSLKPPRLPEAADLLRPAAVRFKDDAQLQELATGVLLGVQDGAAALESATNWQRLSGTPASTVAIAESQLLLKQPAAAAATVKPLLKNIPASLDDRNPTLVAILGTSVQSDVARNETARGLQSLRPHLHTSALARRTIAVPIAASRLTSAEEARTWLELVATETPAQAADELIVLAQGWRDAGARFPAVRDDFLNRALAITTNLTASEATATYDAFALQSSIYQRLNDMPKAIASGRSALAKDPKSPNVLVSLANLLISAKADPAEAVSLSTQACELAPNAPPPLIALARAHLALASSRAAAGDTRGRDASKAQAMEVARKLVTASENSPPALLEAASLLETLSDMGAAIQAYEKLTQITQGSLSETRAVGLNNLAFALYSRSAPTPPKEVLTRCKSLAEEAVRILPAPDFLETLGLIESLRKDREASIAAYRRAIELQNGRRPLSALAGLVALLAEGNEAERAEASEILREIDSNPNERQRLSPLRLGMLEQARQALARR